MRDSGQSHFVGLDIGTTTVRCVVGTIDQADSSKLAIIGHGSSPNSGMRKGVIANSDDVADAVAQAVTEAERLSGVQIHAATVNVNGVNVAGINSRGVIAISTANREITQEDRMRVEEAASIVQLPANREIIQIFAKNYRLDGQDNIKDPVGMHGVRLEVDTHIVTAATPNLRNLDVVLEKARVTAVSHTVSSLASSEAVLSRQQKEAGALVIDFGGGTTSIAVLEDGEVQHVAVLPVGGINITNDLAIGLETDLEIAEQVKLQYGAVGIEPKKPHIKVVQNKKEHEFALDGDTGAYAIIEARVEEILEWVEKELQKIRRAQKLPGGIVIVGATANMPGMAEFVKSRLHLATRIGQPLHTSGLVEGVQDTSYATVIGLATLDMLFGPAVTPKQGNIDSGGGILGSFGTLMQRFKKS
ncbi:MAG: cell division protein FtsA [Candidatus Saccharimonadales bacterium]